MKQKPTSTELLSAIQDFLMKDILPLVKDNDALSYKTLVSWNSLGLVSRENKHEEDNLNSELSRLVDLFSKISKETSQKNPQFEHFDKKEGQDIRSLGNLSQDFLKSLNRDAKLKTLHKANVSLARFIRDQKILPTKSKDTQTEPHSSKNISVKIFQHTIETLEEELSISNPRFTS